MKMVMPIGILLGTLLTSACKVNTTASVPDEGGNQPKTESKNWPEYSRSELAGTVFGQAWKAETAVYSTSLNDKQEIVVKLYAEKLTEPCGSQSYSAKPFASVHLPKKLALQEYVTDLMDDAKEKKPLVFSTFVPTAQNMIAHKTKILIESISDKSVKASVYSQAGDADLGISEINGVVEIVNCEAPADFSVWNQFVTGYYLTKFDGKDVSSRYVSIRDDSSTAYDMTAKKYLRMLKMPLVYSISANSELSYNFGPIEGLGATVVTGDSLRKVYSYKYAGPVNYGGTDITLNLQIDMEVTSNSLLINYEVEVPGQVAKTSHQFTLSK